MIKSKIDYQHSSSKLHIEGVADYSLGQTDGVIGILSGWTLELVGETTLQGKREHLESLMSVVLAYARHRVSGVELIFGVNSPVQISSTSDGHELLLISKQKGINPLKLLLDDSQLSDIVRCLDELRYDSRVFISWQLIDDNIALKKNVINKLPLSQRIAPAFIGTASLFLMALILFFIPMPDLIIENNFESSTKSSIRRK